jgi:hypothetical protein
VEQVSLEDVVLAYMGQTAAAQGDSRTLSAVQS